MKSQGFSLIEILVSICVIGLLGALLLPTAANMRDRARIASCLNNMKRIGEGLFSYAADHSASLPPVATVWPPSQQQTWGYAVWSYVGYSDNDFIQPTNDLTVRAGAVTVNVFRCPATRAMGLKTPPFPPVTQANGTLYSYGLNCRPLGGRLGAGDATVDWTTPIPLARIQYPAATAMVTESSFCLGSLAGYANYYGMLPHSNGSNVLFYDGHAEWTKVSDIPRGESGNGKLFWGGLK